jgi:uncharacterized protein (TIGR02145 family)
MMFRILAFLLLPVICLAQVNSKVEKPTSELLSIEISPNEMKRNASFNLEEIKVRWKKAALENCTGVPCVVTPPAPSFTCGTSTISDIDNNVYETVSIGNQCWTKQNLRVTRYNDDTPIPFDATETSPGDFTSLIWQNRLTGAYTIYENGSNTGTDAKNYGFLYNWYATAGIVTPMGSPTKNICPKGWHVPTDGEWNGLIGYLGGALNAGSEMKSPSLLWTSQNVPIVNSSGFTALPGGMRRDHGAFSNIRNAAFFWSATQDAITPSSGVSNFMEHYNSRVVFNPWPKSSGLSIRCLKD